MNSPANFLGDAHSRLLPISIPFRFFIAAAVFLVVFWGLLFLAAGEVVPFEGGTGIVLAAIHILTLGVLVMTAIGASLQLLPVASRKALHPLWPIKVIFLVLAAALTRLSWAMALMELSLMEGAAIAVSLALVSYAVYLGLNLIGRRAEGTVIGYVWAALVSLFAVVILGGMLVADFDVIFLDRHNVLAQIHMSVGIFGFMGMLAFGFSFILIPMFTLSGSLKGRQPDILLGLFVLALLSGIASLYFDWTPGLVGALGLGLVTALFYIHLMTGFLKTGMKKNLGLSFVLIRSSWGMLIAGVVSGMVMASGGWQGPPAMFGFLLLVGWLLTFLLGVLQRIVPFLASMHSSQNGGRPLLLSRLSPQKPIYIMGICHLLAVVLVLAGLAAGGYGYIIETGAVFGVISALSLLFFILQVVGRLHAHNKKQAQSI